LTYEVTETPEAAEENDATATRYESLSSGLGFRYLAAVDRAIERIVDWPQSWKVVPGWVREPAVHMKSITDFPIDIIYYVDDAAKTIVIVAYAPEKREPGYWINRL